jgi:hypothetical protein
VIDVTVRLRARRVGARPERARGDETQYRK